MVGFLSLKLPPRITGYCTDKIASDEMVLEILGILEVADKNWDVFLKKNENLPAPISTFYLCNYHTCVCVCA